MTTNAHWTLYHAWGTCAHAVQIALLEAQATFDTVWLDFSQNQQRSPEFLRVNPKGRVPTLVTPQGVLSEVPALLLFVAQSYPDADLAPLNDPFELARLQSLTSYLASTVHVAHAHQRRGNRWADEPEAIAAMQRKVTHNMVEAFALIETQWLADGPWVLGARYSVADAYLYNIGLWLVSDGVDEQQFPRLLAHRARMQARPAVQAALTPRPHNRPVQI
jgi:glutathione S-transferase